MASLITCAAMYLCSSLSRLRIVFILMFLLWFDELVVGVLLIVDVGSGLYASSIEDSTFRYDISVFFSLMILESICLVLMASVSVSKLMIALLSIRKGCPRISGRFLGRFSTIACMGMVKQPICMLKLVSP